MEEAAGYRPKKCFGSKKSLYPWPRLHAVTNAPWPADEERPEWRTSKGGKTVTGTAQPAWRGINRWPAVTPLLNTGFFFWLPTRA